MNDTDTFDLDQEAAALVAAADATVRAIDQQIAGMVAYIARKNNLAAGQWLISPDRRSLVRTVPAPAPVPVTEETA